MLTHPHVFQWPLLTSSSVSYLLHTSASIRQEMSNVLYHTLVLRDSSRHSAPMEPASELKLANKEKMIRV